jgi:hypothetical protein
VYKINLQGTHTLMDFRLSLTPQAEWVTDVRSNNILFLLKKKKKKRVTLFFSRGHSWTYLSALRDHILNLHIAAAGWLCSTFCGTLRYSHQVLSAYSNRCCLSSRVFIVSTLPTCPSCHLQWLYIAGSWTGVVAPQMPQLGVLRFTFGTYHP